MEYLKTQETCFQFITFTFKSTVTQGKFRQKWLENLIKIVAICLKILPPFHPLAQALSSNFHALSITASQWQLPVTEKKNRRHTHTLHAHKSKHFPCLAFSAQLSSSLVRTTPQKKRRKSVTFRFSLVTPTSPEKKKTNDETRKSVSSTPLNHE